MRAFVFISVFRFHLSLSPSPFDWHMAELKINAKYPYTHKKNHFNRVTSTNQKNVMNLTAVSSNINDCSIVLHLFACFVYPWFL